MTHYLDSHATNRFRAGPVVGAVLVALSPETSTAFEHLPAFEFSENRPLGTVLSKRDTYRHVTGRGTALDLIDLDFPLVRPELSGNLERASERILSLGKLANEWDNDGGSAPQRTTVEQSLAMLRKLALHFPNQTLPSIGLDSDGYFVLSWRGGDYIGSMSIYGDGTYSYYFERQGKAIQSGDSNIAAPIDSEIISLLA